MAKTIQCGFAQAIVLSSTLKYNSSLLYDALEHDMRTSLSPYMVLPEKSHFKRKLGDYVKFIQGKKLSKVQRSDFISKFSAEKWNLLPKEDKHSHTLSDCKVILLFREVNNLIS